MSSDGVPAPELGAGTPSETQATPAPSLPGTGEVATLRLVDEDKGDGSAKVISVPSSAPSEDAVCEPDPATHAPKSPSAAAEDADVYMMDAEVVAAEPPLPSSSPPAASSPQDDAASTDQRAASAECAAAAANPAIASSPAAPDENAAGSSTASSVDDTVEQTAEKKLNDTSCQSPQVFQEFASLSLSAVLVD